MKPSSLFISRNPLPKLAYKNVLSSLFSSATMVTHYERSGSDSLYRRISPIGDPNESILPVLDQWVDEGRTVDKGDLERIIKQLKKYKRFAHALEVSRWMTDKRYFPITPADAAARIHLIYKVHGIEQAEAYFNNVPQQIKEFSAYGSLLNCYTHERSVEKAEALMQKAKDLGYVRVPAWYNIMMNLYYHIGNWEKLDDLMVEMKEKGIDFDRFTFTIRFSAYAAASDVEGLDKIVAEMESNPKLSLDASTYSVIAHGYLKVGLVEKALAIMKKIEEQMKSMFTKHHMFVLLLHLYAEAGQKDELYRIWNKHKPVKVFNKGYMMMMQGLTKFNDIEGAENIFEEWESRGLSYDFRMPNYLIDAYCRNGDLGKAEALLNKGIARGGSPSVNTWYYLAGGYIMNNQVRKAVYSLKNAISVCPPGFTPSKSTFATCVEYLEKIGDSGNPEEFVRFLEAEGLFSPEIHLKLSTLLKEENLVL